MQLFMKYSLINYSMESYIALTRTNNILTQPILCVMFNGLCDIFKNVFVGFTSP